MSLSALLKVRIALGMAKGSFDGIVIGTDSYEFGAGTPVTPLMKLRLPCHHI